MYNKLSFIYIELPKFKKTEAELSNHLEKWLWFFNELSELDEIPESFRGDIINDAFSLSKLANMRPEKRKEYELSLKHHRDWVNTMTTAMNTAEAKGREEGIEEGIEQGIEQGKIKIAKNLLNAKVDIETIQISTRLSKKVIMSLQ
jgi:predicted transposase/invertase (TIGR01784 family)